MTTSSTQLIKQRIWSLFTSFLEYGYDLDRNSYASFVDMGVKADIQRLGSIVVQIKPSMTNDAVILAKTHHHHRQIIVHGNRLSSHNEPHLKL